MYAWVTNHGKSGGAGRALMHRSFHVNGLPRLIVLCRLFGHRPVVEGYGPTPPGTHAARWVACNRCGVRPYPQGDLDPSEWSVGQRYDGPFVAPSTALDPATIKRAGELVRTGERAPGPWPKTPTGDVSAEVVVGRTFGVFAISLKIGSGGSDNKVAVHLRVWPFGALYLSFGEFGAWWQRRLNPTGYESREIELSVGEWAIRWELWAQRNSGSRTDPWWMHGRISLDLVQLALGPKRYSYEDVDEPREVKVRMPHGDDHAVILQLQRQTLGRPRGRKKQSWTVDWGSAKGIPVRGADHGVCGSAVPMSEQAAEEGNWPAVAAARIAERLTEDRRRYGYAPTLPRWDPLVPPVEITEGLDGVIKFGMERWVGRAEWAAPEAQEALRSRWLDELLRAAVAEGVIPMGSPHLKVAYLHVRNDFVADPDGGPHLEQATGGGAWDAACVRVWVQAQRREVAAQGREA